MKILVATGNPAKFSDITSSLKDLRLNFVSLKDMGITSEPKESGKTFEENAILKAKYYSKLTKLPTLADDGGLEIDILGGEPGVKTRRWINNQEADDDTILKYTLLRLRNFTGNQRKARLKAVICLYLPGNVYYTTTGFIEGIIAERPYKKYKPGFPFDALLYFPQKRKYYYQLKYEDQSPLNHRTKAIQKLKIILKSMKKVLQ